LYERQKMSLQKLKEEFKQTEGDPKIRRKMKQVRQGAVPKAAMVITNPTHYPAIRARNAGAGLRGQTVSMPWP
jgi:flagellar biosynthetic protein FlhB